MLFSDTQCETSRYVATAGVDWPFCDARETTTSGHMIGFIFVATALAILSITAVLLPLWRAQKVEDTKDSDLDIYRNQLTEVDRDFARGVLNEHEAEQTRIEISRRLLNADTTVRTTATDGSRKTNRIAALLVAVGVGGSAAGIYATLGAPGYGDVPRELRLSVGNERRENRPSQLDAEAAIPIPDNLDEFDDTTRDLILTRRAATFERPNDPPAWSVLAQTEAAIGQYHRATRAAERVIALNGEDADIDDFIRLLDLMVAGTQGYVSPEAEAIARLVLRDDPQNVPAQYYTGLMFAQNDRPDRAFALWRQVIEDSPSGTLHWNFAANQIAQVAAQLGVDYALPDQRGPTQEDLDAAEDMSPQDRQAMIQGMVTSLADRLATQGGPPQDWARLITSLTAIDQPEAAAVVLDEAVTIFGGDVQAVNILRRAAQEAGISE